MATLKVLSGSTYYTAPGTTTFSIPIFGGSNATFTYGSPEKADTSTSVMYNYSSKIKRNNSTYYVTSLKNDSAPGDLFAYRSLYNSSLLYRRYRKIVFGFLTGMGGSKGSNGQYMADVRSGGGGGGAGTVLFWVGIASDTTPTIESAAASSSGTSNYSELKITCDGSTVTFRAYSGNNGGGGSSACNGNPGGGGSAGGFDILRNGSSFRSWLYPAVVGQPHFHSDYYHFWCGNMGVVAIGQNGTDGAAGGTWGGTGTAATNTFSAPNSLKSNLGLSSSVSMTWSRQDGQGGASIAPGVIKEGNTNWHGSQGQGSYCYWQTFNYSL